MQYRKFILLAILIVFLSSSCNNDEVQQVKFDRIKWNEREDPAFPPSSRVQMIEDLTLNQKLVGLKYDELISLLGHPDYKDSNSLSYVLIEESGTDIDPIYTKDLNFTFSKDSIIKAYKILEWKK